MKIDHQLNASALTPALQKFWQLSGDKLNLTHRDYDPARGAPVFTVAGKYTARGWTEWTEGFLYGSDFLQFDATGDNAHAARAERYTVARMASHVSHTGVHDHGFNNLSTYGNWLRLQREGKLPNSSLNFNELAIKISGAVQAARWSKTADGGGYIYSFNGPHSLFVDTVRSLRSLALAHQLGHVLRGERDASISLLERLLAHAETTARYSIYYGKDRDAFDVRGRTAHESIFNVNDGSYRCPNTQQGYSPFSTWTRGLAWAILGYAEQLEFLGSLDGKPAGQGTRSPRTARAHGDLSARDMAASRALFLEAARATADFYLANSCADGIPMWDTGAPQLHRLGSYLTKPADPFNCWEPVDSSAAAIAGQGLVRLGNYVSGRGDQKGGERYRQAGLTIARTLFDEPYLSSDPKHQGLLLHSVYHQPNGWDYVAPGQKVPNGESSMWGDYHARELALLLLREARCEKYPTFFGAAG